MASGHPDWTRAIALIGQDPDGNLILIQVDADGQLTVPFKGLNPSSDLVTVAVDADGQLFAVMRGAAGEDVLVDSDGFLSAVMKAEKADTSLINVAVDDDGQIIMVPRGQTGNYMAIDASGFMTAILKGDYAGALRTIGLDDDGRISGYLVDDEDQWGQILKVGNAEQAARLGSPVSWDRRGQVQLVFDFADGFHGIRQTTSQAGAAIVLDPTWWQFGGYSAKLTAGTHADGYAQLRAYYGVPPSDRFGVSINWSAEMTPEFLDLRLSAIISETSHHAYLRYDFANTKLQYRDTGAQYQDIATQDIQLNPYQFHRMKLVIDVTDDVFVRAMLDNHQYDMTAALTTNPAVGQGDKAWFEILCHSDGASADIVYIDTIVVTVKEP